MMQSESNCLYCGTGLCPESQADGVPCETSERACEKCSRARSGEDGVESPNPVPQADGDCLDRSGL
jgi:hypothetical protein